METRNLSDRIWMIVVGLLVVLLLAGVVRVFAAPADETYEKARQALNEAEYREAAELYQQVYERERQTDLAADALYWRAYALYQMDERRSLQEAMHVLQQQMQTFPESALREEAEVLAARIDGMLARYGNARSMERVIVRARDERDEERETRIAALNALMQMDPDRAIPLLKRILAGEDPELKRHALMVLSQVDDDAAEEILLQVLETETDPEMVTQSLFWLSRRESDGVYDAVLKAYRNTDDLEVRRAALMAVAQTDDPRGVDLLLEIAGDETADTDLRKHAVYALSQTDVDDLGVKLRGLFESSNDPEFKSMILFGMTHMDDEVSVDWLAEIIVDPDEDPDLRRDALHFASMMNLVDVPFLRRVYTSMDDPDMRSQICYALTQIDDEEAVEMAIQIVRDEKDPEVRRNAVFWLGQFDDPRVAEFLVELIEED